MMSGWLPLEGEYLTSHRELLSQDLCTMIAALSTHRELQWRDDQRIGLNLPADVLSQSHFSCSG